MVFSSPTFLYYFLPVTLAVYFLTPMVKASPRYRNIALLLMSLVFYAWGEPRYVLIMAVQCVSAWGFGLLIEKHRDGRQAKAFMLISVIISLSSLLFFKYTNFFIENINSITGANIGLIRYVMPIGISFYTFQIISYTLDIYSRKTDAQRNILDFSAYVTSFPQLIAGPIVRYAEIRDELKSRGHSLALFAAGARRFIIGLGKKMLLANVFGELVDIYKTSGDQSVLFTWLYVIAFTLQIYFDFSGYSDMAIGLGKIFGFKFPENFNYPYIAGSITDFWKRWHITLSRWFRDYVYIPLGGNRRGISRTVVNMLFVWCITGFWHGADWNFIIWGGFFGVILLAERFLFGKALEKTPRALRHIYTLLIVIIGWVFFDAPGIRDAFSRIGYMFGIGADGLISDISLYYLRSYAVLLIIGFVAATPLVKWAAQKIEVKKLLAVILEPLALVVIMILSTAAMVDGSFNPFIYFRF